MQFTQNLEALGWRTHFEEQMSPFAELGMIPARVARQDKGYYMLLSASGRVRAETAGKLRYDQRFGSQYPTVGDWVAIQPAQGSGSATIHAVLDRLSYFSRKKAGSRTAEQGLCANVDTAFVVSSLVGERGFVLRRIERFLTLVGEAGAEPVIVLNKRDLCDKTSSHIAEAENIAPGVPVFAISATTGEGIEGLYPHLSHGETSVLLGPSGVGKSSIINAVAGEQVAKTGSVRESDGRGKHITSWREMIMLPDRGIIIDTPGMRELQLWADEESLYSSFSDIIQLAAECRFRNCTHQREPGCAVRAAVANKDLEEDRLESFFRQQSELSYLDRRKDQRANQIEQAKWKSIQKGVRSFNKLDPKGKWRKE
jgi:ribosome biogenesis GTPase